MSSPRVLSVPRWSKPQPALPAKFIMWKPFRHAGKLHATMHKKDEASGGKGK